MKARVLTTIRLPADCKAFIEAEAAENESSQNSEIVRVIRTAMRDKGRRQTTGSNKTGTVEARVSR